MWKDPLRCLASLGACLIRTLISLSRCNRDYSHWTLDQSSPLSSTWPWSFRDLRSLHAPTDDIVGSPLQTADEYHRALRVHSVLAADFLRSATRHPGAGSRCCRRSWLGRVEMRSLHGWARELCQLAHRRSGSQRGFLCASCCTRALLGMSQS